MSAEGLRLCEEKMRAAGVPDVAIATFAHYYRQLEEGASGLIPEAEIEPVESVPDADALPEPPDGAREALDRTVVIKLNGGLGTSMGMTKPKSLVPVKDGLTFLDVIARQVLELRRRFDARVPLVLMNSFATRDASLAALKRYDELPGEVPLDFVQNKEPKLRVEDLMPVEWPPNPDLEWCPPGHGDIYTALVTSGMLESLLEHGYEYAFVSNSDNLGAVLAPRILAWFASERAPFLMEVADRTEADRKGGHLAQRPGGRLLLREIAQTPEADLDAFQDISRHRYFNTNSLWVSLPALAEALRARDNVLGLPMIVNRKTVDPTDPSSPEVFQLETAMGAAIEVFEGARALRVPRSRFAPVKTTNDLLALRSDCYVLTEDQHVELAPEREGGPPLVDLDPAHYKLLADFEARFPAGPPSLLRARRFAVRGDVVFGADVVVTGDVEVQAAGDQQVHIADGTVLEG
ncbi:MAG TPA: UTP--glucose-1-phosphate uridylyltransferase [Solirubrobacteraceae bacterium]|nr:UTP--glucose-1-phosphate uridylyltransferase [Solirubrobacteraceae bacterium]